jgi:hypothetical protein
MNIEAEIEKIMSATSRLSDNECYEYPIPEEWKKYLWRIHIQRPYGIAIWDGCGSVILGRVVLSPKKMRKALRWVLKSADAHDNTMAHPKDTKERVWAKLWGK